nr:MAG TPA: structural protein [Herelleviridae sp.]
MSNLHTAIAEANEIMKASDFTFGYDSSIENVTTALRVVLSNSAGDFIIGGKVKPYGSGGLNVSVDPIYAYHDSTKTSVAETEITEPIAFERADDSFNRIDIVQVRGIKEGYDTQLRKFNDPQTGAKTNRQVPTKKCVRLEVSVKKGSNGSDIAPTVDAGCVKIAEVIIPAGTLNITENLIKNVTARKYQDVNENWTANKEATFTPGYLTDIKQEMDAHADNTANPHKVTAAQTGAYSKKETDAKITAVNENLAAHAKNTTNPHKVTAAQTGAYSKKETDAKIIGDSYNWALVDELHARNLLNVLGIRTVYSDAPATHAEVKQVMGILKEKINRGSGSLFSGLRLCDYLDLPEINDGTTTYKWNGEYKNLRIMISGFNTWQSAIPPDGTLNYRHNHLVFTFRHCIFKRERSDERFSTYEHSGLEAYLNGGFKNGLEALLGKDSIYGIFRTVSIHSQEISKLYYVFLPAEREIWGSRLNGRSQSDSICYKLQMPIFRDSSIYRIKYFNGVVCSWWVASEAEGEHQFCFSTMDGLSSSCSENSSLGVAPAFCIS